MEKTKQEIAKECERVKENLPKIQKLLQDPTLTTKQKLKRFEKGDW